ncbi:hypothetical protein DTL42_01375 [Bremerella cremea]|uniref:Uncharacterized protein n=1 Tax=Bremerella cremea TaxID=1031537 RepID=A0A368KXD1_9BACT|nr:hypothetical protein DTL42_01375 [Bremerella cremea]
MFCIALLWHLIIVYSSTLAQETNDSRFLETLRNGGIVCKLIANKTHVRIGSAVDNWPMDISPRGFNELQKLGDIDVLSVEFPTGLRSEEYEFLQTLDKVVSFSIFFHDDDFGPLMARIATCKGLQQLSLGVHESSVEDWAALAKVEQLEELRVSCPSLSREQLHAISTNAKHLTRITIGRSGVSQFKYQDLLPLTSMNQLTSLIINDADLSESELHKLRMAMPHTRISINTVPITTLKLE